jgi:phospholipase/lecithinase/hemolysin
MEKTMKIKTLGCLLLMLFCGNVIADHKLSLYVFGDSLADVGNTFSLTAASGFPLPSPPETRYYQGRFTNGLNAADFLWQKIGNRTPVQAVENFLSQQRDITSKRSQAVSFAYGGSETGFNNSVLGQFNVTGLLGQVGMFRVMKTNDMSEEDAIALIWSGANDYFNQFSKNQPVTTELVVGSIERAIVNLYESGIRHFLVPNLPNLGDVPIAHIMAGIYAAPNIPNDLTANTLDHNRKLNNMIKRLKKLPKIKLYQVDIYSLINTLLTPQLIFPGPAAGCLYGPIASLETCSAVDFEAGDGLIFWDEIHPTTAVHKVFADAMFDAINR